MSKPALTIRVKAPRYSASAKAMAWAEDVFYKECEKTIARAVVDTLAETSRTQRSRLFTILATFFQRVCARTPLDEMYINGFDKNGNYIYHIPDKDRCRFDWYIKCSDTVMSAEDMIVISPTVFNEYNNQKSINEIAEMLKKKFKRLDISRCVIGNENTHFAALEYGEYDHDTAPRSGIPKKSWETGEEHGIKNRHSVQAPVGMLRITQLELKAIVAESNGSVTRTGNAAYRLKHSDTAKKLSDSELSELMKKFRAGGMLRLSDIKRYIE